MSRIGEGDEARFLAAIPTGPGWKIARVEAVAEEGSVPLGRLLFYRMAGKDGVGVDDYPSERESFTAGAAEVLRKKLDAVREPPAFSVLVPVFNPDPEHLREAVESVRAQVYPHWELILADDASDRGGVAETLEALAKGEARIRLLRSRVNGHISRTSNLAAAEARNPWLVLLDHDDRLSPAALGEFAVALDRNPDVAFVYGDEDKIDRTGKRRNPYFKPGWNRQLLEAQNYICHPSAFRADRFREVGGFRVGFEGSQDWDLFLRLTEILGARAILRVPRVLYHWREHPDSTAGSLAAKPYATEAARKAVTEARRRRGLSPEVRLLRGMYWDPAETDEWPRTERWDPRCRRDKRRGTGWLRVERMAFSAERIDWLERRLGRFSEDPDVGVVGVRIDGLDGIRHCGFAAHLQAGLLRLFAGANPLEPGMGCRAVLPQEIGAVGGEIFFLRSELAEELALWRERTVSADAAACGLCRSAVKMGYRVVLDAATLLTVDATEPPEFVPASDEHLLREADPGWFVDDPAFHPVLEPVSGPLKPIRF